MKKLFLITITLVSLLSCAQKLTPDAPTGNSDQAKALSDQRLAEDLKTNMTALSSLVQVCAGMSDYMESVTAIVPDKKTTGYTVKFKGAGEITVRNLAETPDIAVKLYSDGNYYWALGPDFLKMDKAPIMRKITEIPMIKKDGRVWSLSFDDGASWKTVYTVSDVSTILGVTEAPFSYSVNLPNSLVFKVMKPCFSVDFSPVETIVTPGYKYQCVLDAELITGPAIVQNKQTYQPYYDIIAEVSGAEGVSCSMSFLNDHQANFSLQTPATIPGSFKVSLKLQKKYSVKDPETIATKDLSFVKAEAGLGKDKYLYHSSEEGALNFEILANWDKAAISVPAAYSGWISAPATKSLQSLTRTVSFAANASSEPRTGYVSIVNPTTGYELGRLDVYQCGTEKYIRFADPKAEAVMAKAFDTDGDGKISYKESIDINIALASGQDNTCTFAGTDVEIFNEGPVFPLLMLKKGFFKGCKSLREVTFPSNGSLTELPDEYFLGCTSLKTVILPEGLKRIGAAAFKNSGVVSVTYPQNILAVGDEAFMDCTSLEKVSYKDRAKLTYSALDTIGNRAFSGCVKMAVNSMSAVNYIGKYAFENTPNINASEKFFAVHCKKLDDYAFMNSKIRAIHLGSNVVFGKKIRVETIGDHVFKGCDSLRNVYCPMEPPTVGVIDSDRQLDTLFYNLGWDQIVASGLDKRFKYHQMEMVIIFNF